MLLKRHFRSHRTRMNLTWADASSMQSCVPMPSNCGHPEVRVRNGDRLFRVLVGGTTLRFGLGFVFESLAAPAWRRTRRAHSTAHVRPATRCARDRNIRAGTVGAGLRAYP